MHADPAKTPTADASDTAAPSGNNGQTVAEPLPNAAPFAGEGAAGGTPTPQRLDPTRYGDWELNGKCVDF